MVYILNSYKNPQLANQLEILLSKFKSRIRCKRDNCGPIAWDLIDFLKSHGYENAKIVKGTFEIDLLDYLDVDDFSKIELNEIKSQYGDLTLDSMKKWIINTSNLDLDSFYRIPHYWVEIDGLELDPSQKMFHPYITSVPGDWIRYRRDQ